MPAGAISASQQGHLGRHFLERACELGFEGSNMTIEFLAREIFERLAREVRGGRLGAGAHGLSSICVTLHESHVAWGSFEGEL